MAHIMTGFMPSFNALSKPFVPKRPLTLEAKKGPVLDRLYLYHLHPLTVLADTPARGLGFRVVGSGFRVTGLIGIVQCLIGLFLGCRGVWG